MITLLVIQFSFLILQVASAWYGAYVETYYKKFDTRVVKTVSMCACFLICAVILILDHFIK